MMEHKRSLITIDQANTSSLRQKRFKAAISLSSKERKERVGDRILALQQLVSPYGKTDTASVLHEAMDYISFLHEQVKVLSAPYLHSTSTAKTQESESYNLRSKGLCLVPTSCTVAVCDTNGADIWAPSKTNSTN